MGKQNLLLTVAVFGFLAGSCTSRQSSGCQVEGHTSFQEYDMVYLTDLDRHRLDSVELFDGQFAFQVADTVGHPYALLVQLVDREEPLNLMEMPLMVEEGDIKLELGEYIYTSGSPLNNAIQHFLNALQACKDRVVAQENMTAEQVKAAFSDFYRQQILTNKDNAVGSYIFHDYASHLLPADLEQVKAQLPDVQ